MKLRPGRKFKHGVDLLEPHRTLAAHEVAPEGDHWRATGKDPFLVFRISDKPVWGAFVFELEIDTIAGRLHPRLYIQAGGQWSQDASVVMRRS